MSDYEFLQYETHDDGTIVRILLDRPEARNAQNRGLLVELDHAFLRAEADDHVPRRDPRRHGSAVLLRPRHGVEEGDGGVQHPSDELRSTARPAPGAEKRMLQEWHYYFENTRRWRNLRKITVAQVQGTVFAAGLMLMWACDLIVGADDVVFADVVGTRLGMCGLEYFAHPWELGARKTKELMLTGDSIDIDEAHRLGMVSKVFPRAELEDTTLDFARRIATLPTMTALMIKESVNETQDNQGFYNSLNACFTIHQLNHSHWAEVHEDGWPAARPEDGVPHGRKRRRSSPRRRPRCAPAA